MFSIGNKKTIGFDLSFLVPVVGLEPTRMISPQDFESSASASFTTPAQVIIYHNQIYFATIFMQKALELSSAFSLSYLLLD